MRTNSIILKLILSTLFLTAGLNAQWITGFYESQNGVEPVTSIPWSKYTHIVHFAAAPGVDSSGNGNGTVSLHWLSQSEITQMIAARPVGKKILVCIQDNGSNLNAFSQSTAPAMISTFVSNIANFVKSNGYDGVDIDWESNINASQYIQLFMQLRAALPTKIITADMNNGSAPQQVAAASQSYVDQLNIMCYDLDTPGNGFSWYNDALVQNGNSSVMTCDWRVNPFLNAGVPPSKIGIGLPFYGRRWYGVTKALVNGNFSVSTVLYNQLVTDATRWQPQYQFYDSGYKSHYLSIPSMNEFDSYTGPQEIQSLASWIKTQGFGGAMTFSLYYEYLSGQSGDARYPLSTALYNDLMGSQNPPPLVSGGAPSGTLSSNTTQVTLSAVTNESATCKYATATGTAYSAMPFMFAITGGTSHSVLVTGLTSGKPYTYYVRCSDASGHADTSDYQIFFSVAPISNTVLPPGLIGYWNFDEDAGTTAHDTSGSGYNAAVNGATWSAGKTNSALSFNGTTNYAVTPNIGLGNAFSISAWVNPAVTNQASYARIAETQYDGGLYLGTDVSGTKYKFIVNTGKGATGPACGAAFGCAQGGSIASGWHLVTGTFDGTTARLYVDGAQVSSETFTAPVNTNFKLYIGRYYRGNGYGWHGVIDGVHLFNRALTAAEIRGL